MKTLILTLLGLTLFTAPAQEAVYTFTGSSIFIGNGTYRSNSCFGLATYDVSTSWSSGWPVLAITTGFKKTKQMTETTGVIQTSVVDAGAGKKYMLFENVYSTLPDSINPITAYRIESTRGRGQLATIDGGWVRPFDVPKKIILQSSVSVLKDGVVTTLEEKRTLILDLARTRAANLHSTNVFPYPFKGYTNFNFFP